MTAIILAGGKASRMGGRDKAFLKIGDETLIGIQLRGLKNIFKEIIIVTNSPDRYIGLKGVKVVSDIVPYQGPLGGIFSGLTASNDNHNFIVACDMPFLNGPLIKYMTENRNGFDIIVPKIGKRFHPLFGIYSKDCIPAIEEMLKKNRLKVTNIFPKVRTRFILKDEITKFDGKLLSLVNINTKKDLTRAKEIPQHNFNIKRHVF